MKPFLRIIFFTLFLCFFISPDFLSAIDTRNSARILDNFKQQEREILFETLPFSQTGSNIILENEYAKNGLEWLKAKLSLVQSAYQIKKDLATERRTDLETAIATIDKAIQDTANQITDTANQITEKEIQSQELAQVSLDLKKKIYLHRNTILEYLANIYSDGNILLDKKWEVDIIKTMILSEENIDSLLQDVTYKSLVTILGQKFVDEYRSLIKEYYLIGVRMQDEKAQLEILKKDLIIQQKNIELQKSERVRLLEITKWQEDAFHAYIEASEKAKASVEDAWQKADENYQKSISLLLKENGCDKSKQTEMQQEKCEKIREYFAQEEKLRKTSFATGSANILTWPVQTKRLSTIFHDAEYYSFLWSQHEWIDIPVPQWTDIKSVAPGYVYYILPPTSGGYSYIAIKHRDSFVSVYGHLSEVSVELGQFVEAGEIVGKSGWAPWTPGAGPMTSGPHLHFELWKNRHTEDPLRYLSLADLEYTDLLPKYQDKFIADLIEKVWTWATVGQYQRKFIIEWKDESSRQKYLLSKYATVDFNNWDLWVDTALEAKIDPSFFMCVGLAETTLWNHLKTPYNIGNVWNTDSWSTYEFSSPSEWLMWMSKTFNNKFLSKYTKLSELSRWWNPDGAIYASSNANWHNNIIRCLSALKWRFVEDNYPFRIQT